MPRNPILTKLFRMVKLAENAGFGFDKMDKNWEAYNHTQPHYQIALDSVIIDFPLVSVLGNGESTRNISGISAENELTADDYGRLWTIMDDWMKKKKRFCTIYPGMKVLPEG